MRALRNLMGYTLLASTTLVSMTATAAIDGTLGPTSTGEVNVELSIGAQVQISELNDIILNPTDLTVPAQDFTSVCVYSNQGLLGGYGITATSTNAGGGSDFLASNGSESLPYTATWAQDGANLLPTAFPTSGAKLTGQVGASTLSTSCLDILGATIPTAAFGVSFAAADLQQVPSGTYTDTVILFLEPN